MGHTFYTKSATFHWSVCLLQVTMELNYPEKSKRQ